MKRVRPRQQQPNLATDKSKTEGYSFNLEQPGVDLSINVIKTSKDDIEQPALAKHTSMYIPPLGSAIVISGKSGSGKSTLLANFMSSPRFYGPSPEKPNGWFDKVFLFSPTANGDDIQKSLGIDKKHVFTDLDEAPELLDMILSSQQKKLDDAEGADKVEQFAIIFDDIIGDTHFMNERSFTKCFYQVRHVNCTTFICTQHFNRVPKICRLQANFVFFFQGSAAEVEIVVDEFAPPQYTKKEFRKLVSDASNKKFSFLTINMKVGWDKRFRRNLDEFIRLDRLENDADDSYETSDSDESGDISDTPDDLEEDDDSDEKDYAGREQQEQDLRDTFNNFNDNRWRK